MAVPPVLSFLLSSPLFRGISSIFQTRKVSPPSNMPRPPIANMNEPVAPKDKSNKNAAPEDLNIPDNYVAWVLKNEKELPPITLSNLLQNINWISLAVLTVTPSIANWGYFNVNLRTATFIWSVMYYFITGLGMSFPSCFVSPTRPDVRCASSRYHCRIPPIVGSPFVQRYEAAPVCTGHCRCRCCRGLHSLVVPGHRAHHRYTDTDLDPYNIHRGFWWAHIGWMIFKARRKPGAVDVSDLSKNEIILW